MEYASIIIFSQASLQSLLFPLLHTSTLQVSGLPFLHHIQSFAFSRCCESACITPYVVNLLGSVGSQEDLGRRAVVAFSEKEKVENARESSRWQRQE